MDGQDDKSLLQEYAAHQSETAFETLVSRYAGLVYSAALRQTRDPHQAEEVTQAVFIIFANKAAKIRKESVLSGWLLKTTRFVALAQSRAAVRRRQYEEEFQMQPDTRCNLPDPLWEQISPLLDEALVGLGDKDRQAVLSRFMENKSLAEVGGSLGVGEDAARMRINRALEKLRRFFLKRGVVATAAIIAGSISTNSVQAAPAALVKTITAAAIVKGATAGSSTLALAKGALKLMAWTKAKTAVVVGACLLIAGGATTIAVYHPTKPVEGIPEGWSVLGGSKDQWAWADGKIKSSSTNGSTILASSKTYKDITLSVLASTTNRDADVVFRMLDADNGYMVLFVPEGTPWSAENGAHVSLIKKVAGEESSLASYHGRGLSTAGQSAKVTVKAKGSQIEVSLNDVAVLQARDTTFTSGVIGLRICGDTIKPCDASFASLTFK